MINVFMILLRFTSPLGFQVLRIKLNLKGLHLRFADFQQMLDFEDHAAHASVVGQDHGCPHAAQSEGGHGRLLAFFETYRTFLQFDFQG